MTVKVLLDTDIGSDIDDAIALAYLLTRSDCLLLGITTVTGDVVARARLASAICRAADRRVMIVPGARDGLNGQDRQPDVPQAAALSRWPHDRDFPAVSAIDFMARTIRMNPGEVVLLTIGPLTNVALLFREHPEVASQLRSVITMGGSFLDPAAPAEWNILCDPSAAKAVLRVDFDEHMLVGLDVTRRVSCRAEEALKLLGSTAQLAPVVDMAQIWFQSEPLLTFHDPLAAVLAFDRSPFGLSRGNVQVSTEGENEGRTRFAAAATRGRHIVAAEVSPSAVLEHLGAAFSMAG